MNNDIIAHPHTTISPDLLRAIQAMICEESQVIVHCLYISNKPMRIRIQPTTFLYDATSAHKSELVHVENIIMAPRWQEVPATGEAYFSLVFSGLPESCTAFDLIELFEPSPFKAFNIPRNDQDVYFLKLR